MKPSLILLHSPRNLNNEKDDVLTGKYLDCNKIHKRPLLATYISRIMLWTKHVFALDKYLPDDSIIVEDSFLCGG